MLSVPGLGSAVGLLKPTKKGVPQDAPSINAEAQAPG